MEELKNQGIPVYANLTSGYFEAVEVAAALSVLKVIDNPYQDIPLASVLRSPIVPRHRAQQNHDIPVLDIPVCFCFAVIYLKRR